MVDSEKNKTTIFTEFLWKKHESIHHIMLFFYS